MITPNFNMVQQSLMDLRNYVIEQDEKNSKVEMWRPEVLSKVQTILKEVRGLKEAQVLKLWASKKIIVRLENLIVNCQTAIEPKKIVASVQRINALVQIFFGTSFELEYADIEINAQYLALINIFKLARAKMMLGEFGEAAHSLVIEEDPKLFDFMHRFVLLEMLTSTEKEKETLIKQYKKNIIQILNERGQRLMACTHADLVQSGITLYCTIIPEFIKGCNEFREICSKMSWDKMPIEIKEAIYRQLVEEKTHEFDEALLDECGEFLKLIRSISQITANYHKEFFTSVMKLSTHCHGEVAQLLGQKDAQERSFNSLEVFIDQHHTTGIDVPNVHRTNTANDEANIHLNPMMEFNFPSTDTAASTASTEEAIVQVFSGVQGFSGTVWDLNNLPSASTQRWINQLLNQSGSNNH